MSVTRVSGCAWCALPKPKQGLVVGIVATVFVHAVFFAAISQIGEPRSNEVKKPVQVIDLGTITIHAPRKVQSASGPKEI